MTSDDLLTEFPHLPREDIDGALRYAAAFAERELPLPPTVKFLVDEAL